MKKCYAVCKPGYEEYEVLRVYEDEGEARAECREINEKALRERHDGYVAAGYVPPNAQYTCRDPIETCPSCADGSRKGWGRNLDHYEVFVDVFPFVRAKVPV